MLNVLVANKFEQSGLDGLKALGCAVSYQPDLTDAALAQAIAGGQVGVLIVRSTKVTDAMMAPSLKLIVRAGAGVNTIDVDAATKRGILVANCPGKNAIAVAELTMGLILALDRRIPENVAALRAGKWNKKEFSKARGLYGRTLGVIGVGHIGREVIVRAAAFGMPVVLWDVRFPGQHRRLAAAEAEELGLEQARHETDISVAASPAEVAAACDVLTVHVAFAPETRHLINAEVLSKLKPGSFFVNAARGEVVDYEALRAAVREKGLRVALDVFAAEPAAATADFADPIVQEGAVYGTHHIGASTDQAQEAIAAETVRIVRAFMETGQAPNVVNEQAAMRA